METSISPILLLFAIILFTGFFGKNNDEIGSGSYHFIFKER